MKTRKLGNSGLDVSSICLGGNVFGWTIDEATSFKILNDFIDAGGSFIDTADVYSRWAPGHQGGESETVIGRWMKQNNTRNKVILATKVGMEMGPNKAGLAKNYIISAVEASLKRLQTDHIDLYISHQDDNNTPLEETLEIYGQLIKHGKIRVAGASNFTAKRLTKAMHASHKATAPAYQSLQPQYNLFDRAEFERELEPVCKEFHLGVTPYSSLASGFLTGKYRGEVDFTKSVRGAGMARFFNERGIKILEALDAVAKDHECSPATIAIAWLMSRPVVSAPIVSATSTKQLKDITKAATITLSQSHLERLDKASDPGIF